MNTKIKTAITATATATALAAAAGALVVGGGTASAAVGGVEDGAYTATWNVRSAPWSFGPGYTVASGPASIHNGLLTIAGQSGRLTATPDGARAVIAGVPVTVRTVPADYDDEGREVGVEKGHYYFDVAGARGGVLRAR